MPGPKPTRIELTKIQRIILERKVRCQTCPQRDGKRARIILEAAVGLDNQSIAVKIGVERGTVRFWRQRWLNAGELFALIEQEDDESDIEYWIGMVLSDEPRPGGPTKFTPEQICQLVAIACERPGDAGRPVTHWTPTELAGEAVKRGVVKQISSRTVGRFLKGSRSQATSKPVLAEQRTCEGPGSF